MMDKNKIKTIFNKNSETRKKGGGVDLDVW